MTPHGLDDLECEAYVVAGKVDNAAHLIHWASNAFYRVHKEPAGSDTAFAETDISTNECVIAVPFLKRFLCAKLIKHNLEFIHV